MDQLISQITQQVGISEDQARQTVQVVLGFLRNNLPGPVASQVEGLLSGTGGTPGLQGIGGITDQTKQQLGDTLGGIQP